jgi:HK97 family phage portal protein
MGFAERVLARTAPERRAITEWGTSAIPGPLGDMAGGGSFASVDLRRAESALQKVAVSAAIDLIAGIASQLPLQTFRAQPDGTGRVIGSPKLVQDPGGDDQGCGDWIYQYIGSKLMRGNAYGAVGSYDLSTACPTQIVLYHPDDVHGWRDRDGIIHWRVNGKEVPASQVWHRRAYPIAGQLLGMSQISRHATVIGQGIAAARFGMQFFTDGGHPTVVMQNSEEEIDQAKAKQVKARLMSTAWGSREPLVTGRGWDFKTLSVSPNESQFLETQKYTAAECARMFGPCVAEILGYESGGSMTYANQEQRALDFLKFTLNRWLRDVEAVFTRYLPKPQYVRFDRRVLLETDLMTRYNAHRVARDIGLSNIDEIRAMEDLPPLPDGQGQDFAPLMIQVAAARGIDAAQVKVGEPLADQPSAGQRSAEPDPKGEARTWDPVKHPHGEHGHWARVARALTGQDALDAVPAKLTPGPRGHQGDYAGELLAGPHGMGSVRALSEYEGVEYHDTNTFLRGKVRPADDELSRQHDREVQARVAEIDKTMAVSRLTADVQTHRIVKDGSATFGRDAWYGHIIDWNTDDFDAQDQQIERWEAGERPDLTGLRWTDPGYVSTSVSDDVVQAFGGRWRQSNRALAGEPVIMRVLTPKGTGGVQMSGMDAEAEILLQRGLTFEVAKDHGVDSDGFRRLDVTVLDHG